MTTYFTSDWHLGHNTPNYDTWFPLRKQFWKTEDQFFNLVNAAVTEQDTLIHLGDFMLGKTLRSPENLTQIYGSIYERLQCKNLLFIWGNHDDKRHQQYMENWWGPECILGHYVEYKIPGMNPYITQKFRDNCPVTLSHYPMGTWNRFSQGAFHLHGHTHGNYVPAVANRSLDVSVDNLLKFNLDVVISMEEVCRRLSSVPEMNEGEYLQSLRALRNYFS